MNAGTLIDQSAQSSIVRVGEPLVPPAPVPPRRPSTWR